MPTTGQIANRMLQRVAGDHFKAIETTLGVLAYRSGEFALNARARRAGQVCGELSLIRSVAVARRPAGWDSV